MRKIFVIFILLSCIQCNHKYEYSNTIDLKGNWGKKDTLNFNFKIKDVKQQRNINFVLRNNNEYPYSNIYLLVKLKQGGRTYLSDTLNYRLAEKNGKWLGTGIGTVKEIYLGYKKEFSFPKEGEYTLSVIQGIRKDTLLGIEDFGVNID